MAKDSTAKKNWFVRHKILTGIGCFLLFIVIVGALSGGGEEDVSSIASEPPTDTDAPVVESVPEAVSYGIGDTAIVGEVRWTVTNAYAKTSLPGAFGGTETTQGKFVVINVTVENLGKDMRSMSNLKITDDQGRKFTNSSKSFEGLGAEKLFLLENLNPNVPFTFADVYEVPADAKGFVVTVGDLKVLGNKEANIGLGF